MVLRVSANDYSVLYISFFEARKEDLLVISFREALFHDDEDVTIFEPRKRQDLVPISSSCISFKKGSRSRYNESGIMRNSYQGAAVLWSTFISSTLKCRTIATSLMVMMKRSLGATKIGHMISHDLLLLRFGVYIDNKQTSSGSATTKLGFHIHIPLPFN